MNKLIFTLLFLSSAFITAQKFSDFEVLENPFDQTCNLQFKIHQTSQYSLNVLSITGATYHSVFNFKELEPSTFIVSISTTAWANGIYFAVLENGEDKLIKRLLKTTGQPLSAAENVKNELSVFYDASMSAICLKDNEKLLSAYLIDMQGKVVMQTNQLANVWQLDNIPNGVYVLTLLDKGKVIQHYKFAK